MRKLSILPILLFTLSVTGCALVDYYRACKADEACVARVHGLESSVSTGVSTIGAVVPHPAVQVAAPIAGKISGTIAGIIGMLIWGHALTKKKTDTE